MTTRKKKVDSIEIEDENECSITVKENNITYTVFRENIDVMAKIVIETDKTTFKGCMIPPYVLEDKLCEIHPELKTDMFRLTKKYYELYYLPLKILDNKGYIDYYKDGTVMEHKKLDEYFPAITPIKRGVNKFPCIYEVSDVL